MKIPTIILLFTLFQLYSSTLKILAPAELVDNFEDPNSKSHLYNLTLYRYICRHKHFWKSSLRTEHTWAYNLP